MPWVELESLMKKGTYRQLVSLGINLLGVFILFKGAPGPPAVTCDIRNLVALGRGGAVTHQEGPSFTVPL